MSGEDLPSHAERGVATRQRGNIIARIGLYLRCNLVPRIRPGPATTPRSAAILRILVTGGAGFIGSNLAIALAADGHEVVVADSFRHAHWTNLVRFEGDVLTLRDALDIDTLKAAGPFDVISHQASITDTTVLDQHDMMRNNVEQFRSLLDWAVERVTEVLRDMEQEQNL